MTCLQICWHFLLSSLVCYRSHPVSFKILVIVFFSSEFYICFLLCLMFPCWNSHLYIHLKSVFNTHLNALSGNSSVCVALTLISVNFLFWDKLGCFRFFVMLSNYVLYSGHFEYVLWDPGSFFYPLENVDIFILAGNQPREFRLQVLANLPVVCGFNVTSTFKAFVVLFWSVPCVCNQVLSQRPGQWSMIQLNS